MKIVDKYLFKAVLVPLLYCLAGFILIYIIYDLFDNLPDFIEGRTPLLSVIRFYCFLMPSVLIIIAPVSLMLAVLYSLSHLTKNNELTAMRACGISLYRLMAPLVILGLSASILVGVIHETLGPWSAYWAHQFIVMQKSKGDLSTHVVSPLPYRNELGRRDWMIGAFNTQTFDMRGVNVIQQRPDGSEEYRIVAKSGHWYDGRWWLQDLSFQAYDAGSNPLGPPRFEIHREMTDYNEVPSDFINEIKDPEYLSSLEILTFLKTHKRLSNETVSRVRANLHHRLSMPWNCLVVTLLGIPFGAKSGRHGAFLGIVLALSLFFGYYVFVNVGLAFGKKQLIAPWIGGWLPNLAFLAVGLILIHRMR
ncbi:MAG TPA: LptF/LptG family permease [Kiritimatiellia bacterium]|nr:LptF/LptG family permease [Kiritimatiellia bacterium]HRZ12900.1 LptF/LptG family permease [Kiritimatiellia bacterium]HSA18490.1 LptF/LptG family permease [Kiritimatiellia bacterium]